MVDRTLSLGIDSSGAKKGADEFKDATDKIAAGGKQAAESIDKIGDAAKKVEAPIKASTVALGAFVGGLAVGAVEQFAQNIRAFITDAIKLSDTYTNLDSRIKLVIGSTGDLSAAHANLLRIANDTSSSFEATATLFTRVARNADQLGVSYEGVSELVDTLNKALVVSGSSSTEASASLYQLSQAFASGTLRGDELRSILEQFPRLTQMLADSLGVPIGVIEEMGRKGEISSQILAAAIQESTGKINSEYEGMADTVDRASTRMRNQYNELIVDITKTSGAHQGLINVINLFTDILSGSAPIINLYVRSLGTMAEGARLAANAISILMQGQVQLGRLIGSTAGLISGPSPAEGAAGASGLQGYKEPYSGPSARSLMLAKYNGVDFGAFNSGISGLGGFTGLSSYATPKLATGGGRKKRGGGGRDTSVSDANSAQRALEDLETLNAQYLDVLDNSLKSQGKLSEAFDVEQKKLDTLHQKEIDHLNTFKFSADQRAQAVDLVNKKYELQTQMLTRQRDLQQYSNVTSGDLFGYKFDQNKKSYQTMDQMSGLGDTAFPQLGELKDPTFWSQAGDRLSEFGDKLGSVDSTVSIVVQDIGSIGDSAIDAFANAVVAGTDFGDMLTGLLTTIEQTLIKLAIQLALQKAIAGAAGGLGGLFGGAGAGAGASGLEMGSFQTTAAVAHSGGVIGIDSFPMRTVPTSLFANAPRFAGGGEVPIIAHSGEHILTPSQMASRSNVNVNIINNNGSNINTEQKSDGRGGLTIDILVDAVEQSMASRTRRPGSLSNQAVRSVGQLRAR